LIARFCITDPRGNAGCQLKELFVDQGVPATAPAYNQPWIGINGIYPGYGTFPSCFDAL